MLQIHEEAKKFSYQTGVRVVVAYGGAPIHQQVNVSADYIFGLLIYYMYHYACLHAIHNKYLVQNGRL